MKKIVKKRIKKYQIGSGGLSADTKPYGLSSSYTQSSLPQLMGSKIDTKYMTQFGSTLSRSQKINARLNQAMDAIDSFGGLYDSLTGDNSDLEKAYGVISNGVAAANTFGLGQGTNVGNMLGSAGQAFGVAGGIGSMVNALAGDGDKADKVIGLTAGGTQMASALGSSLATSAMPYVSAATGLYNMSKNAVNSAETGVVDPVGGALNGAATGAAVGSIIPGVGTAAGAIGGAVVGAVTSSIGTPGSVDHYGNITNANGLNGLLGTGHSKGYLHAKAREAKANMAHLAANNRLNYLDEDSSVTLAAQGGTIPNTLAYLDDGELIRTPDGQISEIPEEGKPTDSNLVNVPVGTQVLSDKMKVPGTNKTYAQVGKQIMKVRKYNNDRYAQASKQLNDMNNQIAYNKLLSLQESRKKKHTESKYGIPEAQTGNAGIGNVTGSADWLKNVYGSDAFKNVLSGINLGNFYQANALQNRFSGIPVTTDPKAKLKYNKNVADYQRDFNSMYGTDYNAYLASMLKGVGNTGDNAKGNYTDGYGGSITALRHLGKNDITDDQLATYNSILNKNGVNAFRNTDTGMINFEEYVPEYEPAGTVTQDDLNKVLSPISKGISKPVPSMPDIELPEITGKTHRGNNFDTNDLYNTIGALGLLRPRATWQPAGVYTYEPTFGPTTYDINPVLRDIDTSNAQVRYNAARRSPSTGAGMAQNIAASMLRNRSIAQAYQTKYNMENNMRMQNASIANARNKYDAEARHSAAVETAQNKAAADMTNQQYLADAFKYMQTKQQEYNQARRDDMYAPFFEEYLKSGFDSNVVNKAFRKNKNSNK